MPMEFLSDEQAAAFGRYGGEPSRAELERFFFLDDADQELIGRRRGDQHRLGFALQLGTVRFLGTFLADPLEVPWSVVEYLAAQLGVEDASVVKRYTERLPTQHEHAREIRAAYGYRGFSDPEAAAALREFMDGRARTHNEGPVALFTQSTGWLRRHRVLLPGVSVLVRLVSTVREAAAERLYRVLAESAAAADPGLPGRLRALLEVPPGQRLSVLERHRRAPTRTSGQEMSRALERVAQLAGLGVRAVDVSGVPENRLAALARYGLASKAPTIRELAEPRRTATLLAAARQLDAAAVDDTLDLYALLMATRLINPAQRASNAQRLAWLPRLEKASVTLAEVGRVVAGRG